ncbi:endonuclease/exonuclease/phosphatase family protein [soil metagenome]
MDIAIYIVGLAMIVATALPILSHRAWWIRILDFPRLQIVFLIVATIAAHIVFVGLRSWFDVVFLILLAASLVHQGYMMFPYTPLAKRQVADSRQNDPESMIALLVANVLMDNRRSADLLKIIREADPELILLAETDGWWLEQVDELAADYPFVVRQPQDNTYGMLLYSRLELIDPVVKFIVQDDVPSISSRVRLRSGKVIEIRCLHPRPPFPTEDSSSAPRDAELLIIGKEKREDDAPYIVFGDLNDVAWSRTNYLFRNISGLLEPRVGRSFFHTFPAGIPLIRFPLDHFFHSNHFRLADFKRLAYYGSDHFPVYIKLSLESDAEFE